MMNERDTHFQGFAKLLWDELVELNKGGYIDVSSYFDDGIDPTNYRLLIAQRAYDLAVHLLENIHEWDIEDYRGESGTFSTNDLASIFKSIPDLTAWPPYE